ncbi:MAG: SsrA-binding protein SmpB [Candidatus Margulisbacteria bacterium]|jgi:SsrA-binding protein|nr:SsrA-binding protein SmpB [Candidatus Margulisiibacteriota bacterium]
MASNTYYKVVAENRQARFDYQLLEVYKAGLILQGNEVKSLRLGNVTMRDSFARADKGEIWLYNLHLSPYSQADQNKIDPLRKRQLLLNKKELVKLSSKAAEKGLTLVPLKVYFDGNWAKIDIALAKPKKKYEKRDTIRRREAQREIASAVKGKVKHGSGRH